MIDFWSSGGSGGGSGTGWDDAVDTYADLPAYADHLGEVYLVRNTTGSWFYFNKKQAGLWRATASGWEYAGSDVKAQQFGYYVKSGDWADLVQALESGTYSSIFIPRGTYTCTDDETTPLNVHVNVKLICGESESTTIINADCGSNSNIQDFMVIPSEDCVVKNFTIKNFGNGVYSAIKGTVDTVYNQATKVIDCYFENILNNSARCVYNCNAINLNAKNDSSVGIYGRGILAQSCYGVFNCRSEYLYTLTSSCENVIGNYIYHSGNAIANSKCVDGNNITSCWRGLSGCDDVGMSNKIYSAGLRAYDSCTFHNTYYDNTDNTKKLTHDYSGITTGNERTATWQDKDGTVAYLEKTNSAKTGNYTMTGSEEVILANGSSSAVTVTLPSPSTYSGRVYIIKAIDITNTVKIARNGTEKIEDVAGDYTFANQYDSLTLISDGTNWWRID